MVDADDDCTPHERTRRALHRSVDRICETWPRAAEDANARGYPKGRGYDAIGTSSESTSVEAAALTPSPAVGWTRDAEHLIRQVIRHANLGLLWWPPPAVAGQTVDGIHVGGRTSSVEWCAYCGLPVMPGQIRRVGEDSVPVHRKPCWYAYRAGNPLKRIEPKNARTTLL